MLKIALLVAIALVAAIVLTCAGCARTLSPTCSGNLWTTSDRCSPVDEMMALTAEGHVACVRQGVLVRGRSCSR